MSLTERLQRFLLEHDEQVLAVENSLRTLTYILPGMLLEQVAI
jgi:hypothetical protein